VAGDVRNPVGAQLQPTIYVPIFQTDARGATLMVKAASSANALTEPLRALLRSASPDSPAPRVANLETAVEDYLSPQRFTTSIYGLLAGIGLLVAALGVYGVMAYWAGSRTSEMGVRMALGARSQDVLATVLASGVKAIVLGVAAGLLGALYLQRWIAGELHDVAPHDPVVLAGVAALMAAVGLAASLRPALRAARTSPAMAIKHE
jgi:ABC-type antimicrobial peptide transport system permease subunit